MRNLKKILALALALVMTLSLVTVANAFTDDKDFTAQYTEAAEVLAGLKVLKGYTDGSFAPKGEITRAEVAATVYRIVTGDVNDKQVSIYADYNKFDDVKSTKWYAGYVNYCANAGLVKGRSAKVFDPEGKVTGYEALAIILRAVGYGQNGEFEGAGWDIHTASQGQKLGVLKNINQGTLGMAATREMVAEIIFQTIATVDQTVWTPSLGYYLTKGLTLGEQTFGLAKSARTEIDNWGRPGYKWTATKVVPGTVAVIAETPVATYTTAVAECQVAADTKVNTDKNYVLYVNGKTPVSSYMVNALDTVTQLGAQGRLTEVYADRIVMIDTHLASVTDVKAAVYDAAGHLAAPATIILEVYNADTTAMDGGVEYKLTSGTTNWTYAKGDMVLVNAYMTTNTATTSTTLTVGANNYGVYGEILGKATSVDGAQTIIWWYASQHTVNGTNYNDAYKFHLDQAQADTSNHTWFFDQYGNLIGAVDIAANYSFGAIKNIWWAGDATTGAGKAMATLVYMDGTENTVTLGGVSVNGAATVYTPTYSIVDSDVMTTGTLGTKNVLFVATNALTNAVKDNTHDIIAGHLFRFETAANGAVYAAEVATSTTAAVNSGVSTVAYGVYINSDTKFLVRNVDGTYTAITGYTNIANYVAAEVDYVELKDGDVYAELVYIIGAPTTLNGSSLFYLTSTGVERHFVDGTSVVDYYVLHGYVDGVLGSIKVKPGADTNNNGIVDLVDTLVSYGPNKMFVLKTENGFVKSIQYTVATDNWDLDGMNPVNPTYAGMQVFGIVGNAGDSWNGDVYTDGTNRFNVTGLTPVVGEWAADMSTKNVVLVYRDNMTVVAAYIVDKASSPVSDLRPINPVTLTAGTITAGTTAPSAVTWTINYNGYGSSTNTTDQADLKVAGVTWEKLDNNGVFQPWNGDIFVAGTYRYTATMAIDNADYDGNGFAGCYLPTATQTVVGTITVA